MQQCYGCIPKATSGHPRYRSYYWPVSCPPQRVFTVAALVLYVGLCECILSDMYFIGRTVIRCGCLLACISVYMWMDVSICTCTHMQWGAPKYEWISRYGRRSQVQFQGLFLWLNWEISNCYSPLPVLFRVQIHVETSRFPWRVFHSFAYNRVCFFMVGESKQN